MVQGELRWYTVIMVPERGWEIYEPKGYWVEAHSVEEAAALAHSEAGDFRAALAVYIGRLKDQTENLWCQEIKEERGG